MSNANGSLSLLGRALASVLMCASLCSAANRGPDPAGYKATDNVVYSFVDISNAGGVSVLSGVDDGSAALNLPFSFRFYNQNYNMLCVSSNGAIYFVTAVPNCSGFETDFANTDLTVAKPPNDAPAIFPFWTDLSFQVPGSGSVYYKTSGPAGSRKFIIQWNNAFPQGSPNPTTFQVILSEGNNNILFQYQSVALGPGNPADQGGRSTVGIRAAGAVASKQEIEWSYNAPVIPNSSAILFTSDGIPPVTQATPVPPANGSGWNNTNVVVNLAAVDNPGGSGVKQIEYSLSGAQILALQTVAGGAASVSITAQGSTTLTYFAVDNNGNVEASKSLTLKIDNQPPEVSGMPQPGCRLFPPNLQLVTVATVTASDTLSGVAPGSFAVTAVSSEQQTSSRNPDIVITPSDGGFIVQLRASRRDNGSGRTYTITAVAADVAGNTVRATADCIVPHDQGN